MRVRDYAQSLVQSSALADKLTPPPRALLDHEPGAPVRVEAPGRGQALRIRPAREVKVPRKAAMRDASARARILHALTNHELQAVELFAWALLAFPDMPTGFRRGLLGIIADEQRHMRLYMECMTALGVEFGDYPVTGHFWHKMAGVRTPLAFVCTMGLTFENANLDFAQEYAEHARAAGDPATVRALDVVHNDEINHVRFAWKWLQKLKRPQDSAWQAYVDSIAWPLSPARARGKDFCADSRRAAGLDDAFIDRLAHTQAKRPSGAPR